MNENHVCYICGNPASFQLKNKKWCCQPFAQQCPVSRDKRKQGNLKHWAKLRELGYTTQFNKDIRKEDKKLINSRDYSFFTDKEIEERKRNLEENPSFCKCDFCGNQAFYILKNGKYCCNPYSSQCPSLKEKNSKGCLRFYEELENQGLRKLHYNYEDLPEESKERMKVIKKGDTIKTNPIIAQMQETRKQNFLDGKWTQWNKGVPETGEHKESIRKGTIKYLKESGMLNIQASHRISIKGSEYIDNLNKEKGWNLRHGFNGGEFEIGGYFLDGYDKEKNIAFEYDEPYHYIDWDKNILREKDIERQRFIINKLGCEFYRYNEKKDYFYKVES